MAQAVKASGAIVRVEPPDFEKILSRAEDSLIVTAEKTFFGKKRYEYLVGYKGLVFYTKSATPILLPGRAEVVAAKKIWIP
jgi:hypothetical protein